MVCLWDVLASATYLYIYHDYNAMGGRVLHILPTDVECA